MSTLQFAMIFMAGVLFLAGAAGFCLLKNYNAFKKTVEMKSQARLWLAFSGIMLTFLIAIFGATTVSISLKQRKFSPIRISAPWYSSADIHFALSPAQEKIMNLVYEEVEVAIQEGNPPFAAIITDSKHNILARSHNQANTKQLAIAHAEIEAIQMACKILGKKKLSNCILYANAESCAMCSTAIMKSEIRQVFYGASHEKGSNPDIHLREINKKSTPQMKINEGFMQEKFIEQIKRGRSQKACY